MISAFDNLPTWPSSILLIINETISEVFSTSTPFGSNSANTSVINPLSNKRLFTSFDHVVGIGIEGLSPEGPGLPIPTSNILCTINPNSVGLGRFESSYSMFGSSI